MKGRKPSRSRFTRGFLALVAALGLGSAGMGLDNLPKDPDSDTQKVSTFRTDGGLAGYNISPSDQFWKVTLGAKSAEQKADFLIDAARTGDSWRVAVLLENGVSPQSSEAVRALNIAAWRGDADVVKALLDGGVYAGADQSLALRWAAEAGHTGIMQQLINRGADVTAADNDALMQAAARGQTAAVRLILQQQSWYDYDEFSGAFNAAANPNAQNGRALELAAAGGHFGAVQALIEHGANVNAGDGAALYAAVVRDDVLMAHYLLQNKADPDLRSGQIRSAASSDSMQQILRNGGISFDDAGPSMF